MRTRLFGVPVTVDPFFLVGLVLVWSWAGGDRRGLFAAVFVGVLTVVHEFGHALTARRFGATTAITLNLLVGWASYSAPRPLTRAQRNTISLAGPLSQILAALPVLYVSYVALGNSPSEVWFDVWVGMVWAGIVIGLLNLLPLWPLDGGHVVDSFLGGWLGERRGRRVMLIGTLVAVGAIFVAGMAAQDPTPPYSGLEQMVVDAQRAPLAGVTADSFVEAVWEQVRNFPGNVLDFPFLLLIFCGLNSYVALRRLPHHDRVATFMDVQLAPKQRQGAPGAAATDVPVAARDAERLGWLDGAAPAFPAGWGPSPWLVAHHRLRRGDRDGARAALGQATQPGRPRWTMPEPADQGDLAALVALLEPLPPVADPERSLVLLRVLAAHGSAEQVAHCGVALYSATANPEALYLTAAGLGRTGHGDEAMAWLRRAVQDRPDHNRLATDRGLWPLHGRADFQQLLAEVRPR